MQEHDAVNTVRLVAQAEDHITQSVSLYYDDGVYYAFLPSYADTNSLSIVYNNAYSLYLDGEYYDSDSQFSTFEPNRSYEMIMKNSFHITVCNEKLIIMK